MKEDRALIRKFRDLLLDTFWLAVTEECPVISGMVLRILLPFWTTYFCEVGFSTLTETEPKNH
jgi:hypothetical protein